MADSVLHQDFAGESGAPLGLFRNGELVRIVPRSDGLGDVTRAAVAAELGLEITDFEVLLTCPAHPATAAVDCLICVPEA